VQTSTERILTTHTGSIARPDDLIELMRARENGLPYDADAFEASATAAVAECVRRQVEAGLAVINDGEQRKSRVRGGALRGRRVARLVAGSGRVP
jgi:5-methyltetrahydropteroyltriglutamate--homocysteine methyltransferase